jgi:hypothetical protein
VGGDRFVAEPHHESRRGRHRHTFVTENAIAARVRLLDTGRVNKYDPSDARSVAVAALRTHAAVEMVAEDQAPVLKLWSRRYQDRGGLHTQIGLPSVRRLLTGWAFTERRAAEPILPLS